MKILDSLKGRGKYTLYGALFGALFPVVSFLLITSVSRDINILFAVICTAPLFLGLFARFAGIRQDRLDGINRELEQRVAERTRSIQSLLDVSGQGFLSFDRELLVGPEYSRECESIFGQRIEGKRIDELFFAGARARVDFRRGLGLYFDGAAKPDVIFDLLDATLTVGQKTLRVEYRAVTPDRVMATLTDITDEVRRLEESRAENERRAMLLKVIANRRTFSLLDREATALFSALEAPRDEYREVLRDAHTFKGNAGFLGFRRTQDAAHEVEDYLADRVSLDLEVVAEEKAQKIEALRAAYAAERAVISDALGRDWLRDAELVEIPRAQYLLIERHVRRHYPSDSRLIATLEGHRMIPLAGLFDRFPQMAGDLAARLGKRLAPVTVTCAKLGVAADEFEDLVASFAHIMRNMVDHGIETPAEREAAGKHPEGNIRVDIGEVPGHIVFTFSDDGRGVSLADVEKRGRALGLIADGVTPPPPRLLALIFRDGFTTSSVATTLSGRGVGLPAVWEAVRKMGGWITVKTANARGTVFTITVPRRRHGEDRT